MVAQHLTLHAPEGGNDRRDLVRYVNAVALRLNHLLQTTHLSFDAAQARQLFSVVNRHTAVSFL